MGDRDLSLLLRRLRHTAATVSGVSDAQLLQRFVGSHDEAAFELLLWRHARLVFGVCRRVLHDHHDAEDAFQATVLIFARRAARISNRDALASWLYKVAFRTALTLRTNRARATRHEQQSAVAAEARGLDERSPAELAEFKAVIDEEVSRLPERLRAAVVLCYLEGKTVDEAAVHTGWPRGTVASRLARARARLRVRLTKRGLASAAALTALEQLEAAPRPLSLISAALPNVMRSTAGLVASDPGLSRNVLALSHEVLKTMFWNKLKTGGVVVFAVVGILLAGGGLAIHLRASSAGERVEADVDDPHKPDAKKVESPKKQPEAAPALRRVIVNHPVRKDFTPYAGYAGTFEALHTVEVRPRVSGRLEKISFKPGRDVKKGDVLFEIDPSIYQVAVDKAEAGVALAEARMKGAESIFNRAQKLHANKQIAQEELDKSETEAAATQAGVRSARADLNRARLDLAATKVTAPISGQIGRPQIDVGNQVLGTGDRPTLLATITSFDPIGLTFDMDERSYLRYQQLLREHEVKGTGSPLVLVMGEGEKKQQITGTLESFDVRLDAKSGTIGVYGTFPNRERILLPGMFARVELAFGRTREVLEIPQSAVFSSKGEHGVFVFVINKHQIVERRPVKLAENDGDMLVVAEGLRPDDAVLIQIASINEGEKVQPEYKATQHSSPKK